MCRFALCWGPILHLWVIQTKFLFKSYFDWVTICSQVRCSITITCMIGVARPVGCDVSGWHIALVGGHKYEVFTFPGLFRMESMWNPWNKSRIPYGIHGMNVGWDPSQFLIPWTSWILCGMRMECSIPHGFHMGSTWIPWNKFNSMVILLECQRSNLIWSPKIVAPSGIEH